MPFYDVSSSAVPTRITTATSNEHHIILPGIVLESTDNSVMLAQHNDTALTVAGFAIGNGGSYAITVDDGAADTIITILETGQLFGGGILTDFGDGGKLTFINQGRATGNDVGYSGGAGIDEIINTGVINSTAGGGVTVNTNAGQDYVYNAGIISGSLALGEDNDTYVGGEFGIVLGGVFASSGNDTLRGSEAGELLDGGSDSDLINGRGGDDTLMGDTGADTIFGGDGNDSIDGEVNNDVINGNAGDDTILGSGGDDTIRGGRDDDALRGGTGADNIRGDSGDDLIIGGADRDDMFGGSGNDVFLFENVTDSGTGAVRDRIYDFRSGEDVLDIGQLAGPQFQFIGSSSFSGSGAREVRAVTLTNGTLIYIDQDGDGTRDSDIYLLGTFGVVEGDFLL